MLSFFSQGETPSTGSARSLELAKSCQQVHFSLQVTHNLWVAQEDRTVPEILPT